MVTSNSTHIDQGAVGEFAVGEFVLGVSQNIFPDAWYQTFRDPVRVKPGLLAGLHPSYTAPSPIPLVSFGWMENLSEPVRLKRGLRAEYQQTLSLQPAPSPFVATGWYNWLTEPVRLKPGTPAQLQPSAVFYPLPYVSFGWFIELSKPQRLDKLGLPATQQQTLAFHPNPIVSFGWMEDLSQPVRLKPGLRAVLQRDFTNNANWIPASSTLIEGWYSPLSEPKRFPVGLKAQYQKDYGGPDRLLPTPTVTVIFNTTEIDTDNVGMAINVVGSSSPGRAPVSARVSIVEIGTGLSATSVIEQ